MNKAQQQANQQYQQHRPQPRAEGRIQVDYVPPKGKSNGSPNGNSAGDFVEFEEIK